MRLGLSIALFVAACGTQQPADDTPIDCSTVTGVDMFVVGLEHQGVAGSVDFKLMSIDPSPPQRGDNTWIVQVNSMASGVVGNPIDGATIDISSYMPAHMHYSPITPTITPQAMSGQYEIKPVNLWMSGVWETTVIATAGATTDRAVFKFCIP
jgi:YtkA-like protein